MGGSVVMARVGFCRMLEKRRWTTRQRRTGNGAKTRSVTWHRVDQRWTLLHKHKTSTNALPSHAQASLKMRHAFCSAKQCPHACTHGTRAFSAERACRSVVGGVAALRIAHPRSSVRRSRRTRGRSRRGRRCLGRCQHGGPSSVGGGGRWLAVVSGKGHARMGTLGCAWRAHGHARGGARSWNSRLCYSIVPGKLLVVHWLPWGAHKHLSSTWHACSAACTCACTAACASASTNACARSAALHAAAGRECAMQCSDAHPKHAAAFMDGRATVVATAGRTGRGGGAARGRQPVGRGASDKLARRARQQAAAGSVPYRLILTIRHAFCVIQRSLLGGATVGPAIAGRGRVEHGGERRHGEQRRSEAEAALGHLDGRAVPRCCCGCDRVPRCLAERSRSVQSAECTMT